MAHFGSKKDGRAWLKFNAKDEPKDTLGKKLEKEQRKRRAAEKEVDRLKKEVERLNGVIRTFTGGSPTH